MPESNYHPGLEGIVAGETAVSTLEGGLLYRGYAVEELAEQATYEEVAYLVLYGELPKRDELAVFKQRLVENAPLPAGLIDILRRIPAEADMMDVMRSGSSLLAHWDAEEADSSRAANFRKAERLLARLPGAMAARHRLLQSKDPVSPDRQLGFAENVLWMLHGQRPSPDAARAMNVSLIMYAEHEFNASTFTARVVASTLSDLYSAVTAAIGALKGPLHGGANERVLEVLEEVGSPERAEAWVRDALARKVRIMGFGHRVYKDGDPRAVVLKELAVRLATDQVKKDMERTAEVIERVVLAEKKLKPNLDWPAARIYHYLGLPVDLYTPLFVISRVVGWCAHVMEQLEHNRLIRPSAIYTGPAPRSWKPMDKR